MWTEIEALGEEVGVGMGTTERTAMMAARANAQEVKKPKTFWMRFRVLCMMVTKIQQFGMPRKRGQTQPGQQSSEMVLTKGRA